jgi:hypothetical protein
MKKPSQRALLYKDKTGILPPPPVGVVWIKKLREPELRLVSED